MSMIIFTEFHPIVIDIHQSKPQWWTLLLLEPCVAKNTKHISLKNTGFAAFLDFIIFVLDAVVGWGPQMTPNHWLKLKNILRMAKYEQMSKYKQRAGSVQINTPQTSKRSYMISEKRLFLYESIHCFTL